MKRLLLASLLCVVAVIVAPVAAASATEVVHCEFAGNTEFNGHLFLTQTNVEYKFNSKGEVGNKCKVKVTSEPKVETEVAASATVKGKGKLSCTLSPGLGVAGLENTFESGSVTVGGKVFTLSKFEFVGTGPVVTFSAEGTGGGQTFKGEGSANFVTSTTALAECASTNGLPEVGFTATSAGVVK
jgi:hypothetical protein